MSLRDDENTSGKPMDFSWVTSELAWSSVSGRKSQDSKAALRPQVDRGTHHQWCSAKELRMIWGDGRLTSQRFETRCLISCVWCWACGSSKGCVRRHLCGNISGTGFESNERLGCRNSFWNGFRDVDALGSYRMTREVICVVLCPRNIHASVPTRCNLRPWQNFG